MDRTVPTITSFAAGICARVKRVHREANSSLLDAHMGQQKLCVAYVIRAREES